MKNSKRIYEREKWLIPVVVIDKDIENRIASTIRHNRARWTHNVELMVNIVQELVESWMTDAWIQEHIWMDRDELLRLKQISWIIALFNDKDFSY
jgi:ParB-like chromosome segregation protein Spo0J